MSQVLPLPASPTRKRPFPDGHEQIQQTPPKGTAASPNTSSSLSTPVTLPSAHGTPTKNGRQPSPAPSSSTSVSVERAEKAAVTPVPTSKEAPPAKRRKLTSQEKEAQEKAKAEEKAKKEEARRLKEEEKKRKAEEIEEKRRLKEIENQQKEEEKRKKEEEKRRKNEQKEEGKRKKEEEKAKKERSQLRLNAFFTKPKNSPEKAVSVQTGAPEVPAPAEDTTKPECEPLPSENVVRSPSKKPKSDYERMFLPFELPSHATCAPYNRFGLSGKELEDARQRLDHILKAPAVEAVPSILEKAKQLRTNRGIRMPCVRDIIARLNGSIEHPIDLTDDDAKTDAQLLELLRKIPMKYIHFGEDVRPPYFGTYTKCQSEQQARKLARNPTSRALPETDYDYDSEAEWVEPEEGEDLGSDDEDDLESDNGEDMEDFLDDEDVAENKRRLITGDLEPVCTGIYWEDTKGVSRKADEPRTTLDFTEYQMATLLDPQPVSIDPFSTAYWDPVPSVPPVKTTGAQPQHTLITNLMQPPSLPLSSKSNGANSGHPLTGSATAPKAAQAGKRQVPADLIQEFKAEVSGSDMTKIAIIEHLKKKFPKVPKDAIANTLTIVAKREGPGHNKRWVLHGPD